MSDEDEDSDEQADRGFDVEAFRSYVGFAKRAVRQRWRVSLILFGAGAALSLAAFRYLPRTFRCETVLMGQGNEVLEGRYGGPNPFVGASELIMRRENLESIIREEKLVSKFDARRAPLFKLKDQALQFLFGEWTEDVKISMLVGMLESRLDAEVDGNTLTINVEWPDGPTSAEIADAAREGLIKTKHSAEMSAFQEKMDILDGHATRLRDEIEKLAQQIRAIHEQKVSEVKSASSATPSAAPPTLARPTRKRSELRDAELPALKEKLDAKTKKLSELQADWDKNLRAERSRLAELKLRLAASHPDVVTQEKRIAMAAQEPPELALLRAETKGMQEELAQRRLLGGRTAGGAGAEPLPTDIVQLLDEEDVDPALAAQLSGAVAKYGALRSEIRSSRIDLDTAQAAFNQRYKIIVPADRPLKPIKPKAPLVIGGGLFASLLLALLLPILAELRRGIMTARWQVDQIKLPILAELRLPPRSPE